MGYEIDYIAVGEGERSGDAIAIRYGNLYGERNEQTVIVIDGGTKESGKILVSRIQNEYGTDRIDIAFCSHPDGDHASGLEVVIEELDVDLLVMHRPWNHATEILDMFEDGRITDDSLEIRIRKSLQAAHDLETAALARGVKIEEAFTGSYTQDRVITVLGPTREYYQELLGDFRGTPAVKSGFVQFAEMLRQGAQDAVTFFNELLHGESLVEPTEGTSAENNSSLILHMDIDGSHMLFTGDAGVPALTAAADYAESVGIDLASLLFLDVPHHGSKRNVGPSILDRIKAKVAYLSASAGGAPKHPSKKVTNALTRRGASVYTTQGRDIYYHKDSPNRANWSSIEKLPLYQYVEE